jgi:hypothetical protein
MLIRFLIPKKTSNSLTGVWNSQPPVFFAFSKVLAREEFFLNIEKQAGYFYLFYPKLLCTGNLASYTLPAIFRLIFL